MELICDSKVKTMTMTSIEMSELVEKRHDNVKRTIDTLINQGVIASPQIEEKPTDGRTASVYVFTGEQGKRDSIIVVAQLSPKFTARLVDRWQELEAKVIAAPALPQDPIIMLRLEQLNMHEKINVVTTGLVETRTDVNHLKQNMRVENWQQCNIQKAVHSKSAEFKELYPNAIYGDIIRKIWRFFKSKFAIPRYQELPAMRYDEAMRTLHSLAMHNLAGL